MGRTVFRLYRSWIDFPAEEGALGALEANGVGFDHGGFWQMVPGDDGFTYQPLMILEGDSNGAGLEGT